MILDLLPSFNAGELDPRMDARAGLDKYQAGCRTLKNFIPIPFGGASKRPGTKYILSPTTHSLKKRIVGFKSGQGGQFILVFRVQAAAGGFTSPLSVEVVKAGAIVFSSTTPPAALTDTSVFNFVTEAEIFEFQYKQLNDVLVLVHPNYPPITLTRYADNDWRFADYFVKPYTSLSIDPSAWPPMRDENINSVVTVTPSIPPSVAGWTINLVASANIFNASMVGSYFSLAYTTDGNQVEVKTNSGSVVTVDSNWIQVVGTWNAYSFNYWEGTFEIHRSYDATNVNPTPKFEVIRSYKGVNGTRNWTTGGSETAPAYLRIRFIGKWITSTSTPDVHAVLEVASQRRWGLFYLSNYTSATNMQAIVHYPVAARTSPAVTITAPATPAVVTWTGHGLVADDAFIFRTIGSLPGGITEGTLYYVLAAGLTANTFRFSATVGGAAINSTGTPGSGHWIEPLKGTHLWAEGAWSPYRGYPRTIELYSDRVFFGGNGAEPLRVWGSTTGDFKNFRRTSLADGSIAATISGTNNNIIQWLASTKGALIVGTDGDEHAITAPDDGILAPNNLKVETQSAYGSAYIAPLMVNYATLFLQRSKARVREFVFSQEVQGYVAPDMTRLSNILVQPGIKQWDLQRSIDAIVWGVTTDGKLVGMTYEREENVVGWHRHETDGTIESVGIIYGAEGASDEVYLIVNRTISGSTVRYLEVLDPSAFSNQRDGNASDLVLSDSAKIVTGVGLTSATGLSHLEGKTVQVLADGTRRNDGVVSGGAVAISGAAASKVVVGLAYEALLKPMKIEVPMRDGTAQMRHMKLTKLAARVWKSLAGEMRPDDDTAWEALVYPQATLYTGDLELSLSAKTLPSLEFAIRSNDPLPLTILALVPKFDVSGQ